MIDIVLSMRIYNPLIFVFTVSHLENIVDWIYYADEAC